VRLRRRERHQPEVSFRCGEIGVRCGVHPSSVTANPFFLIFIPVFCMDPSTLKIWSIRSYLLFILLLNYRFYSSSMGVFTLLITFLSFSTFKLSFILCRKYFSNIPELLLKRIFSGVSSCFITPVVLMAMSEDSFVLDEAKFAISKWMLVALGLELGCLIHDSAFLTKKQLEMTGLIIHHLAAFSILHWIIYRNTITLWLCSMYILLMEGTNPFWYLHWTFLSTGSFKKYFGLYVANYFLTVSTYIYLRFMVVHVKIFGYLFGHYSSVVGADNFISYLPDLLVAISFNAVGFCINVLNTYKVTKSFVHSVNPSEDEENARRLRKAKEETKSS